MRSIHVVYLVGAAVLAAVGAILVPDRESHWAPVGIASIFLAGALYGKALP